MLGVAFDATPLVGERTGIGIAVTGMLRDLAARPELRMVGYGLTAGGWLKVRAALPAGAHPARGPMPAGALIRAWGRGGGPPVEWWSGPVDVVHGTNYVAPPSRRAARLVSVWDLTAVRYPELCTPTSRRYPGLVQRAIDEGAWVHTGAESVAREICDHFGADSERVRVVAPGIDPHPVAGGGPGGHGAPYVLSLGRTEPRKDLPTLVAAFDELAGTHRDLELVLAGPAGWAEQKVLNAVAGARHRSRIRRLGWVADPAALVAGAAVFAYPSLYEGFGFPPLEAMAAGTPVVATAAGALPETAGDAAVLVPPSDAQALAAAIGRVLDDGGLRSELVRRGRERAAAFSWAAAGDAMSALYSEVATLR